MQLIVKTYRFFVMGIIFESLLNETEKDFYSLYIKKASSMNLLRISCLLILSLTVLSFSSTHWTFVESQNGINVYQRVDQQTDRKWFRLSTVIDYPMEDILNFTGSIEKLPEWVYACKETKTIDRKENEITYYSVTDMPFPMSDRDVVIRKVILHDEENKTFTSISTGSKEFDIESDYVRVSHFEAIWFFEEIDSARTMVTYDMYVNPGESIPDWVKDRIVRIGPMKTMINLKNKFELKK